MYFPMTLCSMGILPMCSTGVSPVQRHDGMAKMAMLHTGETPVLLPTRHEPCLIR
jgi:hypothetical protein